MRIFRRSYTKPIPRGAKILRRRCGKVAQFTGRGGRIVEARLTDSGDRVLCTSTHWFVEFVDNDQIAHTVRACTEERPSRELADRISEWLAYCAVGKRPPAELMQWFADRPPVLRNELVKAGIVTHLDEDDGPKVLVLEDLLTGFERYLRAVREASDKYVKATISQLRRVFEACDFVTWDDIDRRRVQDYLLDCRNGGQGVSKRTYNGAVHAIRYFCEWALDEYGLDVSPLHKLRRLEKTDTDRRRLRRALSPGDARKLLEATAKAPEREGISGPERALLYRFILETGLRANECRTLTVSDLRLENPKRACVVVRARNSKRRKEDTAPLRPELSAALRSFIVERRKVGNALLFGGRYKHLSDHVCEALRADLADAGLPYEDDQGQFFDLHSGRHTFVTTLVASGLDIDKVKRLARHASIKTTERYMHTEEQEKRAGVERLPDYTAPGSGAHPKTRTGTDHGV